MVLSCDEYFASQNRKVIKIKRDGNCFYSSLSYQLFGTQHEDDTIRFVVSKMVSRNKEIFLPFFIPTANVNSIDQHCECMWISGTWATLVEVVAAATVFMIPVYFVTQSREGFKWNVVRPLNRPQLHYPHFPDVPESIMLQKPSHFELLYYTNLHYDAVVAEDTGRVSLDHPILSGRSSVTEVIDMTDL